MLRETLSSMQKELLLSETAAEAKALEYACRQGYPVVHIAGHGLWKPSGGSLVCERLSDGAPTNTNPSP